MWFLSYTTLEHLIQTSGIDGEINYGPGPSPPYGHLSRVSPMQKSNLIEKTKITKCLVFTNQKH